MNNDLSATGDQHETDLEQQSDTDGIEERGRSLRFQLIVFCVLLVLA